MSGVVQLHTETPSRANERAQRIIDDLLQMVMDARDMGYRAGVLDANVGDARTSEMLGRYEATREIQAHYYAAMVRRALTKA